MSAAMLGTHSSPFALVVTETHTPPVPSRQVETFGAFPQLSGARLDLKRANAAIRRVVKKDGRAFATRVRAMHSNPPAGPVGEYRTSPRRALISASSVVVSALIPTTRILPGLNGGSQWLSFTFRSRTGLAVHIVDLFRGVDGLRVLSRSVRRELIRRNTCVRHSWEEPTLRGRYSRGLHAIPSNFRYFALLPKGLYVGFPEEQVSHLTCGRVFAVIPYADLRAYLTRDALALIRGVRAPERRR